MPRTDEVNTEYFGSKLRTPDRKHGPPCSDEQLREALHLIMSRVNYDWLNQPIIADVSDPIMSNLMGAVDHYLRWKGWL